MKLSGYLYKQKQRAVFFRRLNGIAVSVFVFALSFQFFSLSFHFLEFFFDFNPIRNSQTHITTSLSLAFGLTAWLMLSKSYSRRRLDLSKVAESVEDQSQFFSRFPEYRSELRSAAEFLSQNTSKEFERAHIERWDRQLEAYRVELRPSLLLLIQLSVAVFAFLISMSIGNSLYHLLPNQVKAWNLSSYEIRLPYTTASWETKTGALSAIMGSEVRFQAPQQTFLKTYIFYKPEGENWTYRACDEYCQLKIDKRGRYAVGSLLYRSAQFPVIAVPDEAPRAVIFYKENQDLIPSPTLNVLNRDHLSIQLMASDDLELKSVKLIHRFGEKENLLLDKQVNELRFKEDFVVDLSTWEGGRHELILRAEDYAQVQDSSPMIVIFADEEFLRQQRLLSLRTILDQWVHVLADLLESQVDQKIHATIFERLDGMEWPDIQKSEGAIQVFIEELQRLSRRMKKELSLFEMLKVPEFVEAVEKQILYGLSLILQEKAGDLRASTDGIQNSQRDLQSLIDEIKKGNKELSSEAIQEAFEKLARQLEELQEKIRNLPQGPSDDLINREALEQQLNESESLQERIAQIQEQIANGNSETALKELESLINQLSILSKEIGRSFDQWQENLAQGALQSSEAFENRLKEIRERQEELAKKTRKLEEKQKELEKKNLFDLSPEDREKIQKEFENLKSEQMAIKEDFQEAQEQLQEKLSTSEWEQIFRSEEMKELEEQILQRMRSAERALEDQEAPEAIVQGLEAVELLRKAEEAQQQMRQNVQQMAQPQQIQAGRDTENIEIIESEGKGARERRQKIMNSLRQKVDDAFQKSHERYFEELLQR